MKRLQNKLLTAVCEFLTLLMTVAFLTIPAHAQVSDALKISPIVECVEKLTCVAEGESASFLARFGYANRNSVSINIPVGSHNRFSPAPIDRGQTTTFLPGRTINAFQVPFSSGNVVWTLDANGSASGGGGTATASTAFSQRCSPKARIELGSTETMTVKCDQRTKELDGTVSLDGGGCGLEYRWSTSCGGASFGNSSLSVTTVSFPPQEADSTCEITLEVVQNEDGVGADSDRVKSSFATIPVLVQGCISDVTPEPTPESIIPETVTPVEDPIVDVCGVPNGDGTSCSDCNGVPFGAAKVDICGVCGGDGTSCLDCNNTPFGSATQDSCGVCNGDGLSCAACRNVNLRGLQVRLDGFGNNLFRISKVLSRRIIDSGDLSSRALTQLQRLQSTAEKSYHSLWQLAWSFPSEFVTCDTKSLVCSTILTTSVAGNYTNDIDGLYTVVRKLSRTARSKRVDTRSIMRKARRARRSGKTELNQLPESLIVCPRSST